MLYEGQQHSWVTGFYWTLTVMSTLGFGDITFESDLGKLFTILVLISGIVLLLIVLPFAFIRFFYAPFIESQVQRRAPREVGAGTGGHVVICAHDSITPGLVERLEREGVPYVVIEDRSRVATARHLDGLSVVVGEVDSRATYEALGLDRARLVLANREDTVNTSIILTVRDVAPEVPVVAVASADEAVDVLELSGADPRAPAQAVAGGAARQPRQRAPRRVPPGRALRGPADRRAASAPDAARGEDRPRDRAAPGDRRERRRRVGARAAGARARRHRADRRERAAW